jgi:heme-degrading monooxygenase HmoA
MTASSSGFRPKIARIWRGRTTRARADEYARYWREHGFPPIAEKALAVQMLREDREDETEFVTISYWESVEAMSRLAGDDPRRIHHLPRDPEFLIELPESVQVLEITDLAWPGAGAPERAGRDSAR